MTQNVTLRYGYPPINLQIGRTVKVSLGEYSLKVQVVSKTINVKTQLVQAHTHDDLYYRKDVVDQKFEEFTPDLTPIENQLNEHIEDTNNPHDVTKEQVGLGNVDNTSDLLKPISTAVQSALNDLSSSITALIGGAPTDANTLKKLNDKILNILTLLGSDNVNLDNVQELVDAIETIQTSLATILVNDLTTGGVTKALTAEQGKVLKGLIDAIPTGVTPAGLVGDIQRNNGSGALGADEFLNYDSVTGETRSYLSLGSEKILNGGFTGNANNWTLPSGFTYASNRVGHTANGTSSMTQNTGIVIGKLHKITFDIQDLTVGSVTVSIGGVTLATISANGSYTYRFRAINTNNLTFSPTNTSRFYIDNVSLKEYLGGCVSSGKGYFNDKVVVSLNGSNVAPGTIDHLEIENPSGGYSHIPFKFRTSQKASLGASSIGELQLRSTGGGNTFGFYSGSGTLSSTYLIAYLTQNSFTHYGHGLFGGRVSVNSASTPLSYLNSGGSFGRKTKIVNASPYTPDVYDDVLYVDTTTASGCSGTPSASCSSWTNQSDCEKWDAHGGCSWSGGDCSAFNGDQFSCESNPGCTWSTADCSGVGAYDQSSCESYSGCSWSNSGGDCSGFGDEMTCAGYMGCSWNAEGTSDCSSFSGDQTTCESNSGCSWDYMDSYTCSGSYVSSPAYCSGSYDNYSCVGSYYTGGCAGSYGTCSGTPNCSIINDSTNCGFETGCTWSNNASINLPQGSTVIDGNNVSRVYKIIKARGSGNVVVNAYSGDSIANNGSIASSLTISTLYTGKEFQYRNITADCSTFNNNQSGCESNTCSWNSACAVWNNEGDCTGNGCSWDGMSCSGGSSGTCSGTYTVTKYWYVISSF